MTSLMLFCIDEEAKAFVPTVLTTKISVKSPAPIYSLVQSNARPTHKEEFKQETDPIEPFETDFMGSSVQDCRDWTLENQKAVNFLMTDLIAIVDA
ncbi:hypothetical protein BT63DRAFT_420229 [Microthyrium microscopicum]|uniref:Uncharacterized protein n=1 Tax=Microthyrium microscopicum TaxID=703497 RepID=A0A6A6UT89_9PEZI|nr:hypothetical protein BT63DRAFT_420229 [Microthyrium microscopicum]